MQSALKACRLCSEAKNKCTKDRPACERCRTQGWKCDYGFRKERAKNRSPEELAQEREKKALARKLREESRITGESVGASGSGSGSRRSNARARVRSETAQSSIASDIDGRSPVPILKQECEDGSSSMDRPPKRQRLTSYGSGEASLQGRVSSSGRLHGSGYPQAHSTSRSEDSRTYLMIDPMIDPQLYATPELVINEETAFRAEDYLSIIRSTHLLDSIPLESYTELLDPSLPISTNTPTEHDPSHSYSQQTFPRPIPSSNRSTLSNPCFATSSKPALGVALAAEGHSITNGHYATHQIRTSHTRNTVATSSKKIHDANPSPYISSTMQPLTTFPNPIDPSRQKQLTSAAFLLLDDQVRQAALSIAEQVVREVERQEAEENLMNGCGHTIAPGRILDEDGYRDIGKSGGAAAALQTAILHAHLSGAVKEKMARGSAATRSDTQWLVPQEQEQELEEEEEDEEEEYMEEPDRLRMLAMMVPDSEAVDDSIYPQTKEAQERNRDLLQRLLNRNRNVGEDDEQLLNPHLPTHRISSPARRYAFCGHRTKLSRLVSIFAQIDVSRITLTELFPMLTSGLETVHHFTTCSSCALDPSITFAQLALLCLVCQTLLRPHPHTPHPLPLIIAGGNVTGTGLAPEIQVHIVDIVWATWRGSTLQKALVNFGDKVKEDIRNSIARNAHKDDGSVSAGDATAKEVMRGQIMQEALTQLLSHLSEGSG